MQRPHKPPPPQNNAPAALHKAGANTMAPARGTYILFISHNPPSAPTQSSKTTPSSLTPPRAERDWWGSPRKGRYRANQQYVAPQAPNPPARQNKKICRRPLVGALVSRQPRVAPQAHCSVVAGLARGLHAAPLPCEYCGNQQYVAPQAPGWPHGKTLKICSRRRRPCLPSTACSAAWRIVHEIWLQSLVRDMEAARAARKAPLAGEVRPGSASRRRSAACRAMEMISPSVARLAM